MTIKYWIEGPKASGKTTVLKSIANQMNNGRTVDDQFTYHQPHVVVTFCNNCKLVQHHT